jgi:hypothetical protein
VTPFIRIVYSSFVVIVFLAGCTAAPLTSATTREWRSFETVVDEVVAISYRAPALHDGFSPQPKRIAMVRGKRFERIAGFKYAGGLFDRVIFSTLYSVDVQRFEQPIPDGITARAFIATRNAEMARRREASLVRGAMFVAEPSIPRELKLGQAWWICADIVRTDDGPNVSEIECSRPLDSDLVLFVTVTFGHAVKKASNDYEVAAKQLEELVGTVSVRKKDQVLQ